MIQPVTIRSLLDAAVHFGHQTRRWNPKMKPYIFGERNGVYILDLKQTMISLDQAYSYIQAMAANGGNILFVGTKKQAQEPVATHAQRCNMPYVNNRWLGGMLTNFVTIRSRVTHMEELEAMDADGRLAALPKKEQIHLRKELEKLQANLNGIREMKAVPQVIFVVDTLRESIAIREARRLGIPVVGIIDTNSDPDDVEYGIPGNDDAIRSVNLITEVIAEAVISGAQRGSVSEEEIVGDDAVTAELTAGFEDVSTLNSIEPAVQTPPTEPAVETTAADTQAIEASELPAVVATAAPEVSEQPATEAPTVEPLATETPEATAIADTDHQDTAIETAAESIDDAASVE
jgi:small subunit ribosomal protein S2